MPYAASDLQLNPPQTGSRRAREPRQSPKRVWKEHSGAQKSPKRVQKSGFRLFSDSFQTPGRTLSRLLGPCPGVLFPDFFWTLPVFPTIFARHHFSGPFWGAPRKICNSIPPAIPYRFPLIMRCRMVSATEINSCRVRARCMAQKGFLVEQANFARLAEKFSTRKPPSRESGQQFSN